MIWSVLRGYIDFLKTPYHCWVSLRWQKKKKKKKKKITSVLCLTERKTRSPFLEILERRQTEENAVVHALFAYFGKKLLVKDKDLFSRAVDEVFAHSVLMSVSTEGDSKLVEEVKEHLQTNGLQVRQEIISKVKCAFMFIFMADGLPWKVKDFGKKCQINLSYVTALHLEKFSLKF